MSFVLRHWLGQLSLRRWNLTGKIALFAGVFLLLSLLSVASTLWISRMLQGGAGAVNVVGQLRMMSFRVELSETEPGHARVAPELARRTCHATPARRG